MDQSPPLLEVRNISKSYGGVPVLREVTLDVRRGEVHALVGENGAGKSTLMNVVSGVVPPDSGEIVWEGRPVRLSGPREAQALGISFVHQELALVPQLSVAENIYLGRHPKARGLVNFAEMYRRTREVLEELRHTIDPRRLVMDLSLAERQIVEIARAVAFESRLIIMDEPTAPLSDEETEALFRVVDLLRARGVGVIYISHRLKEIFQISDRVTVLRDGRHVLTQPTPDVAHEDLVRAMIGSELKQQLEPAGQGTARGLRPGDVVLLQNRLLTRAARIQSHDHKGVVSAMSAQHPAVLPLEEEALRVEGPVSLTVRRGEIVGLAGLAGAGRTRLLEWLFGARPRSARPRTGGEVFVNGRLLRLRTPVDAIHGGLALVPDDRKGKGLVLGGSVLHNMALAGSRSRFFLSRSAEQQAAQQWMATLRIKCSGLNQPVLYLSGGTQQKVVLAKWLLAGARVFLLDEPTRGIDVGAKAEIYNTIRTLAAEGAAVLMASSELEELTALSDRILVMHRGRVAGELARAEATEERIMHLATGGVN